MRGRLVVFEGGEGVGKSTQLRRLAARLTAAGVRHRVFREPGGTAIGDRIRELLLQRDGPRIPIEHSTEAALFIASRAQLVAQEIRPALRRGEHVLLDRFMLSTYAYQVRGRKLDLSRVRAANRLAVGRLKPNLTILFSMSPSDALTRVGLRGTADRIERADIEFHREVAKAFIEFADSAWQSKHPECGPIVAIDAAGSEDEVEARVQSTLATHLPSFVSAARVIA